MSVLECKQHQVYRLLERHNKTRHPRLRNRNRIAVAYLVNPQRNHRTARTHHIAITRTANLGLARITALGHGNLLLNGLRRTHRIDWIGSLVGRQADYCADASLDGCRKHIVCTDHIGLNCLHREKLATRHLLKRRRMEDIVNARHRIAARLKVAHIPDKKLYLMSHIRIFYLILMAHIILFLLIARKNADFADVST